MYVKIVTHYSDQDPEFYGDYGSIEILINGVLAEEYGDYYHDKGREKSEGFMDCMEYMKSHHIIDDFSVEEVSIADLEW